MLLVAGLVALLVALLFVAGLLPCSLSSLLVGSLLFDIQVNAACLLLVAL
jgi:hypothetical protein